MFENEYPGLFPPEHVRLTPIPDVLAPFSAASHVEQMRRVWFVLDRVRAMYRRRFSTLWAALEFTRRAAGDHPAAVEAAQRVLRAAAGSYDLRAWERGRSRAEVMTVLAAALAHCEGKTRWLEVAR